jgi:hypothetical protein
MSSRGQAANMERGAVGGGPGMPSGNAGTPEPPQRRTCATIDVHRRLLSRSVDYRLARDAIENDTMERLARRFHGDRVAVD